MAADWAWQWSGGLIDPTIRGALERAGYHAPLAPLPTTTSSRTSSWADVELDMRTQRIKFPAHMTLDLAGVAKSWAAQQALTLFAPDDIVACDAAGDIAVRGAPIDHHAWPIDIEPLAGYSESGILAIDDAHGIATSGIDQRHWLKNGQRHHHIIDPRTGQPSNSDIVRASVIAPSTMMADVAARMCVILGSTAIQQWLTHTPNIAVFAHRTDGTTFQSTSWQHYQWPTV
jgi:thiamine biosynthesis lipoprotein